MHENIVENHGLDGLMKKKALLITSRELIFGPIFDESPLKIHLEDPALLSVSGRFFLGVFGLMAERWNFGTWCRHSVSRS